MTRVRRPLAAVGSRAGRRCHRRERVERRFGARSGLVRAAASDGLPRRRARLALRQAHQTRLRDRCPRLRALRRAAARDRLHHRHLRGREDPLPPGASHRTAYDRTGQGSSRRASRLRLSLGRARNPILSSRTRSRGSLLPWPSVSGPDHAPWPRAGTGRASPSRPRRPGSSLDRAQFSAHMLP